VGSTVKNMTVGRSTARSTGRAYQPFPAANGQNFMGAINTPHLSLFLTSFFESKFSHLYKCLTASFQKSFWVLKINLYLFKRVEKFKEKKNL